MESREGRRQETSPISFLQAMLAVLVTVLLVLLYLVTDKELAVGWFRSFLLAAIPGAAVVAGAYASAYFVLFRHGLTRDQQLLEKLTAGVGAMLGAASIVEQVLLDTDDPDWSSHLAAADRVVIAARSLSRWSSENNAALNSFFDRGAVMEVFSHDPDATASIQLASASHAGYAQRAPERVRTNVTAGLRRIVLTSRDKAGSVRVWYATDDEFVFMSSLFAFFHGGKLVRVVLRPHENVRLGVTTAPVFVLRPDEDGRLNEFVQREIVGLLRISRELSHGDVDALA